MCVNLTESDHAEHNKPVSIWSTGRHEHPFHFGYSYAARGGKRQGVNSLGLVVMVAAVVCGVLVSIDRAHVFVRHCLTPTSLVSIVSLPFVQVQRGKQPAAAAPTISEDAEDDDAGDGDADADADTDQNDDDAAGVTPQAEVAPDPKD
jgi:hypothetical protein